jgi:hypothetical protein
VTIRYQADADLNQAIVTGVLRREPTVDFQTADFQTALAARLEGVRDSAASSAEEWINRIAKLPL